MVLKMPSVDHGRRNRMEGGQEGNGRILLEEGSKIEVVFVYGFGDGAVEQVAQEIARRVRCVRQLLSMVLSLKRNFWHFKG